MTAARKLTGNWRDYCTFHDWQLTTGDVDPAYPVLRTIGDALSLDREQRLWLTFLHVAYYHLGSALRAFEATDGRPRLPPVELILPTGVERRAHRSHRQLRYHLASLADRADSAGGLGPWLGQVPCRWPELGHVVGSVYGNGRWATFKTLEMLAAVNGFTITAPDMGHANSTGPRHGLATLYEDTPLGNSPEAIATLDEISREHVAALRAEGLPATLETAETTLCDWHAVTEGRYYVGHDIDVMLAQLTAVPSGYSNDALLARIDCFERWLLGEHGGWTGIRKDLNKRYVRTRTLVWWAL
jgi:hypothetical protein